MAGNPTTDHGVLNVWFSPGTDSIQVCASGRDRPLMTVAKGLTWAQFLAELAKKVPRGRTVQFMGWGSSKKDLFEGAPKIGAARKLGDWIDGNLSVDPIASSYR